MEFPGDLTPEEREEAYLELRAVAEEKLGADRAAAIETSLRRFSLSVKRLERLRFGRGDAPGFYLHRFMESSH